MFYFLQIVDTAVHQATQAIPQVEQKISMWNLLQKGGWVMYPLYFLLALAVFVFF